MRIVVAPTGEQPECPYCHDALAGRTAGCLQCHTLYHEECARTAVRCALLGCAAALALAADAEASYAIVLVPPRAAVEPTARQEETLERHFGLARFDVHQKLLARVPNVVAWLPRADVEHVLLALEEAGLEAFAIDARAHAVKQPFVVRIIDRAGDGLRLLSTKNEKRELDLAKPRFVVTGRQTTVADRGGAVHSSDRARFVHVWLPGDGRPIVFEQGEVRDFFFLRERRAASGFENFQLLGELLAAGQTSDDSLASAGDTHLLPQLDVRAAAAPALSNRRWVLATSRLIAHARAPWLAGGARP